MDDQSHQKRFLSETDVAEDIQRNLLQEKILSVNADTDYGKQFGFSEITSAEQYTAQVPLIDYEVIRQLIEQMQAGQDSVLSSERTVAFFQTSGSTSKSKLIPVTASLMREKVSAFATFWGLIYEQYPAIKTGSIVSNFSDASVSSSTPSGTEICSESSFWLRRGRSLHSLTRWPLPKDVRNLKNPQTRLYAIARLLLQSPLHCIMSLNPSTLVQLCHTLEQHRDELLNGLHSGSWGCTESLMLSDLNMAHVAPLEEHLTSNPKKAELLRTEWVPGELTLKQIWPEIELIICWSSDLVQPYLRLLKQYTGVVPIRDYITQSSECVMAIPVSDGGSGGLLAYQSHFFEFIAEEHAEQENPPTEFAWQLQSGKRYEIVVTTGGGLYRYRMGDCVRVNGFTGSVPEIEFQYRLGNTSSMTGEKLTENHVLFAADSASRVTGYCPPDYFLCPSAKDVPHYSLIIEWDSSTNSNGNYAAVTAWAKQFNKALSNANEEYHDKCASGRLGKLKVYTIQPGVLQKNRVNRRASGVSEEQVKRAVLSRELDAHLHFDEIYPLL